MQVEKICPTCGTKHQVHVPHEWTRAGNQFSVEFLYTSQGSSADDPKLDSLFPVDDDGQELVVKGTRIAAGMAKIEMFRRPRAKSDGRADTAPDKPLPRSRPDMETEAAELGVQVKKQWSDEQLATAIEKAKVKP